MLTEFQHLASIFRLSVRTFSTIFSECFWQQFLLDVCLLFHCFIWWVSNTEKLKGMNMATTTKSKRNIPLRNKETSPLSKRNIESSRPIVGAEKISNFFNGTYFVFSMFFFTHPHIHTHTHTGIHTHTHLHVPLEQNDQPNGQNNYYFFSKKLEAQGEETENICPESLLADKKMLMGIVES